MLGLDLGQDQPHASAVPDLRGDHRADPVADLQCVAPQSTGYGRGVSVRGDSAAGVRDPGGTLRVVAVPLGEDRALAAQGRRGLKRASGSGEGRALRARLQDPWQACLPRLSDQLIHIPARRCQPSLCCSQCGCT